MSDLAEGSAALQKLLATGSEAAEGEIARDTGNMRDDHLRHQGRQILADGKSIAAGVSSVDDAIAAIEGNPQFVEDIKALIANYVEDAVCGVQLPRIDGEKEWGTYAMMGHQALHDRAGGHRRGGGDGRVHRGAGHRLRVRGLRL